MTIKMNQKMTLGGNQLPFQPIPPQKINDGNRGQPMWLKMATSRIEFEIHRHGRPPTDPGNPVPRFAETLETALKPMNRSNRFGHPSPTGPCTAKASLTRPTDCPSQLKQMLDGYERIQT